MFQLAFDIPKAPQLISLADEILCVGSCFSDNIGDKLAENKFDVLANPVGTIYNPSSIFKSLSGDLDPKNAIQNQGVTFHWDAHSEVSATNESTFPGLIEEKNQLIRNRTKTTNWLILTLGTSFVYTYQKTGLIVANCHKIPQNQFQKRLLSVEEITRQYASCLDHIRSFNPGIKVILTVSPVRHIRDGLHENNISKGILHQAISEIIDKDDKAFYFPSYEIVIDELRDYRFYKEDMIHPSELAVDYIWSKFRNTWIDDTSNQFIDEWSKIRSSMNHKPFHPESDKHQVFVRNLIKKIQNYSGKIDVSEELKQLSNQLNPK